MCNFINHKVMLSLVIGLAFLSSCSDSNKDKKEQEQVAPVTHQPIGSYTDTKGTTWHRDNFDAPHSLEDEKRMEEERKSQESYYDPYEDVRDEAYKKGYEDGYYDGRR